MGTLTKEVAVPTTIIMMLILRFKSTEIWVVLSGIVEMPMQSADDAIYLLPGCPIFGRPEL